MFQNLIDLFSTPGSSVDLKPKDAQAALASILVRIARADDHYAAEEQQMITNVLKTRYLLSDADAQKLKEGIPNGMFRHIFFFFFDSDD